MMLLTTLVLTIGIIMFVLPSAMGEDDAIIRGYVHEDGSGAELEEVEVSVSGDPGWNWTQTDEFGFYEMGVPEGFYDLYADKDGYLKHGNDFYLTDGEVTWYNFTLTPENAMIRGYVMAPDSRSSIENASISIYDGDEAFNQTMSDATGYYEMYLAEGYWYIWAEADDHSRSNDEFDIYQLEEKWINITLLPMTSVIKGYVTEDDSRGPIEGVRISAYNEDGGNETMTDSSGYFEMNIFEGYFQVQADFEGYDRFGDNNYYVPFEDTVWFNASLLYQSSIIRGYITEDDNRGAPIEGAFFSLGNDRTWNQTWTDENGYYEIWVSPGDYHTGWSAEGYAGSGGQITVGAYEEIWMNITLQGENAMIMGYLMDDSRSPVQYVQVEVQSHAMGMRYGDIWTDENGYFESPIIAGVWDVGIYDQGYLTHNEKIDIAEYEEFWFNRTLEIADLYWISGHFMDNDTGDDMDYFDLSFESERYGGWVQTDEDGEFGLWLAGGQTYDIRFDMPGSTDPREIHVTEDGWLDLLYIPPPPFDTLVRGYIEGYENRGPLEEAVAGSMNFLYDQDINTQTDEFGYYEFGAWSGLGVMFGAANDHFTLFMVVNITADEFWYNMTLYPILEDDSTLSGILTDADGEPVENGQVLLANAQSGIPIGDGDGFPFPYMSITDEFGSYEIDAPAGDWYLIAIEGNEDSSAGIVQEVSIFEETTIDITLPEAPDEDSQMVVTMTDWDNAFLNSDQPFSFDGPVQVTRLQIDFMMGNRDGMVDAAEAAIFESMIEVMSMSENDGGDGGDGSDMDNTTDDFTVDGIAYDFVQDTMIQEIINLEGDVTSGNLTSMKMTLDIVSQSPIPTADMHTMLLNQSYPNDEGETEDTPIFILPTGFILESFSATANFSVMGLGTDTIEIEFVGEPAEDTWEWITLIAMVPNVLPMVEAGADQVITEGDTAEFEANATDTDGTIVSYAWDFDTTGAFAADYTSPTESMANHTYATPGNFTVTVRVTDDRGGVKEDVLYVVVEAVVIPPEPTANLQIESLGLSILDPTDGDKVTFSVVLRNTGDVNATGIKVRIFVDDNLKDLLDVDDIIVNSTITVIYDWIAVDGKHTIRIEMTYDDGNDEVDRTITVGGGDDTFIPGFGSFLSVISLLAGAMIIAGRRKQ